MAATDAPADAAPPSPPQVDSRWWYWIAAVPVLFVVGTVAGIAVLAYALASIPTGGPPVTEFSHLPGGVRAAVLLVIPLLLVGVLVSLLAAAGFYFDSEAVAAADLEWEPDPVLWGVVGVVGIFFQVVQLGGALYYLYKRHEAVGTP